VEYIPSGWDTIGCYRTYFHTPFTTGSPETNSQFMLCSIAAAVPPGSNTDSAEVDNPGEDTEAQKRYCRRGCKMMF
jgi:hypothetical protein